MYRFQIIGHTQTGASIGIVGSTPELGLWDITKCLRLNTSADRYPLWYTDIDIQPALDVGDRQNIEYKYVYIDANGIAAWEEFGFNRWIPIDPDQKSSKIVVDDGAFGYLQPYPFGYLEEAEPVPNLPSDQKSPGLKIAVIGSFRRQGSKSLDVERLGFPVGRVFAGKIRTPTREFVRSGRKCQQNHRPFSLRRRPRTT
ncbi:MAG: CBM20 domain-containing protein [Microcoleus sp.]